MKVIKREGWNHNMSYWGYLVGLNVVRSRHEVGITSNVYREIDLFRMGYKAKPGLIGKKRREISQLKPRKMIQTSRANQEK